MDNLLKIDKTIFLKMVFAVMLLLMFLIVPTQFNLSANDEPSFVPSGSIEELLDEKNNIIIIGEYAFYMEGDHNYTVNNMIIAFKTTYLNPETEQHEYYYWFNDVLEERVSREVIETPDFDKINGGQDIKYYNMVPIQTLNESAIKDTLHSAISYEYSDPLYSYNYHDLTYDAEALTIDIDYLESTLLAYDDDINLGIMHDLARYIGALHRVNDGDVIKTIIYEGIEYTWNDDIGLKGSNWVDSNDKTLMSVITYNFSTDPTMDTLSLTLEDALGFSVNLTLSFTLNLDQSVALSAIKQTVEDAITYDYDPSYSYIYDNIDFDDESLTIDLDYLESDLLSYDDDMYLGVLHDLARYIGALHRVNEGTVISVIEYEGIEYTWDQTLDLKGSNWSDGTNTLISEITADFIADQSLDTISLTLKETQGFSDDLMLSFNINFDQSEAETKIKETVEDAITYQYTDPTYIYKYDDLTFDEKDLSIEIDYLESMLLDYDEVLMTGILHDLARYTGALHRLNDGQVIKVVEYNNVEYTWDDALGLKGSNWTDGANTLMSIIMSDFISDPMKDSVSLSLRDTDGLIVDLVLTFEIMYDVIESYHFSLEDYEVNAGTTVEVDISAFKNKNDALILDEYINTQILIESDIEGVLIDDLITGEDTFNIVLTEATMHQITVTINGIEETRSLLVTPAALHELSITPEGDQSLTAGDTLQFSASGQDVYGNNVSLGTITWSETDHNGLFINTASGIYNVQASVSGINSNTVSVTVNSAALHELLISPDDTQTITAGQSVQFSVTGKDTYGNEVTLSNVTWTQTDNNGLFTLNTVGTYTVYAEVETIKSDEVDVIVEASELDNLIITPSTNQTITAGETIQFDVTGDDAYGNSVSLGTINWSGTNSSGMFSENITGNYNVSASVGAITSSNIVVTVVADEVDYFTISGPDTLKANQSGIYEVILYDQYGNEANASSTKSFNFASDKSPHTISSSRTILPGESSVTFNFSSILAANHTLFAFSGDLVNQTYEVLVTPADLETITITPDITQTITAGETLQFDASGEDAYGNEKALDNMNWTGTNDQGLFNTNTAGSHTVYAQVGNVISNSVTVNVEPDELYELIITPDTDQTITAGDEIQFSVTPRDVHGNELSIGTIYWNETDSNGLFNNSTAGSYTVYAEVGSVKSDEIEVTVEPDVLNNLIISPSTDQVITAGDTINFSVSGEDAYGNTVSLGTVDWSGTNSDGLFENTSDGTYTVYAEIGSVKSDEVKVTVEPGPLATLNISPSTNQTITAGNTVQFSVTGEDSHGNAVSLGTVDWSGTNSDGLFDNTSAGTYTVYAEIGSVKSEEVDVTVEAGPLAELSISPSTDQTITAGDSISFSASGEDAYGNPVTLGTLDWNEANTNGMFNNSLVGTYTVYAEIGSIKSNEVDVTVEADIPDYISITGPSEVLVDNTSDDFTITVYDAYGNIANTREDTVIVLSSTTDGERSFTPSLVTISEGNSTSTFTYKDSEIGSPTINANVIMGTDLSDETTSITIDVIATIVTDIHELNTALDDENVTVILVDGEINFGSSLNIQRGVTIKGLNGSHTDKLIGSDRIALISDDLIRLENLTIETTRALRVLSDNNELVSNTFITDSTAISIYGNGTLIDNNIIDGVAQGTSQIESAIIIRGQDDNEELIDIKDITITNNTITNNDVAVMIQRDETHSDITNFIITDNDFTTNRLITLNGTEMYAAILSVQATDRTQGVAQNALLTYIIDSDQNNTFNLGSMLLPDETDAVVIGSMII